MKKVVLNLNRKLIENNLLFTFKNVSEYYWNRENLWLLFHSHKEDVLYMCFDKKYFSLIQRVFTDEDIFLTACIYGNLKFVKKFANKVDSEKRLKGLEHSLIYRDKSDPFKIVKYLIEEKGVEIKGTTNALYSASRNGDLKLVKYLMKKGAKIQVREESTMTGACKSGNLDLVKFLLSKGVGFTIWSTHYAHDYGYDHIYNFLCEHPEMKIGPNTPRSIRTWGLTQN